MAANDAPRRQRRSSEEVRALLVRAARELFAERGFSSTGTRDIAALAGVSESLLFTHFGTKAALFEEAVVAPLAGFFEAYVREWERHSLGEISTWELCELYASGFYDLLREHRELVMALVAARCFDAELAATGDPATRMFSRALEKMDYLTVVEGRHRGFREIDVPVTVRLAVGMVMSVALLDDWLFPGGLDQIPRERLIREMTLFLICGVSSDACCEAQAAMATPPAERLLS